MWDYLTHFTRLTRCCKLGRSDCRQIDLNFLWSYAIAHFTCLGIKLPRVCGIRIHSSFIQDINHIKQLQQNSSRNFGDFSFQFFLPISAFPHCQKFTEILNFLVEFFEPKIKSKKIENRAWEEIRHSTQHPQHSTHYRSMEGIFTCWIDH